VSGSIDYAQARIQARHGARPDPATWASLHASITLAALLENARASPLEAWIAGLDAGCTFDELEAALRARLRGRIDEVARWMPEAWRPAVLWTRVLLDLPVRQHVLRGRTALPWMARDRGLGGVLREPPDDERAALARQDWIAAWRVLWPRACAADHEALEELVRAVESHVESFARAPPEEAASLRLALRARVETLFRRHALTPAAAFGHLLLLALEAERLRAELVARVARQPGPTP
jgi:hypothetical protein